MSNNNGLSDEVHRAQLVRILQHAVTPAKFPLSPDIDAFQVVSRDPFCVKFPLDAHKFLMSYENRFRDPFHTEGTMAATKPWLHYVYAMVGVQQARAIYPLVDIERGKFVSDALALCYHHDFRYAELSYKALLSGLENEGSPELSEVVFKGALEYIALEDKIDRVNSSIAHLIQGSVEYRGISTTYNNLKQKRTAKGVMLKHLEWLQFALKFCSDSDFKDVGWHAVRLYPLSDTVIKVNVDYCGSSSVLSLAHTQVYNIISSRLATGIQRQAARNILDRHIGSLKEIISK